jgi:hypothetical protein
MHHINKSYYTTRAFWMAFFSLLFWLVSYLTAGLSSFGFFSYVFAVSGFLSALALIDATYFLVRFGQHNTSEASCEH